MSFKLRTLNSKAKNLDQVVTRAVTWLVTWVDLNLRTINSQKCVVVTEEGSYLRLIDSCITQLKAQEPSRTSNESKEEEVTWAITRVVT